MIFLTIYVTLVILHYFIFAFMGIVADRDEDMDYDFSLFDVILTAILFPVVWGMVIYFASYKGE